MHDRNAPLLDLGPVSTALVVGLVLFVGWPLWSVAKWILRH